MALIRAQVAARVVREGLSPNRVARDLTRLGAPLGHRHFVGVKRQAYRMAWEMGVDTRRRAGEIRRRASA